MQIVFVLQIQIRSLSSSIHICPAEIPEACATIRKSDNIPATLICNIQSLQIRAQSSDGIMLIYQHTCGCTSRTNANEICLGDANGICLTDANGICLAVHTFYRCPALQLQKNAVQLDVLQE